MAVNVLLFINTTPLSNYQITVAMIMLNSSCHVNDTRGHHSSVVYTRKYRYAFQSTAIRKMLIIIINPYDLGLSETKRENYMNVILPHLPIHWSTDTLAGAEVVPVGHCVQLSWCGWGWYVPAGHGSHMPTTSCQKYPCLQPPFVKRYKR